jgi:hypothetical protein
LEELEKINKISRTQCFEMVRQFTKLRQEEAVEKYDGSWVEK